MNEVWRIIARFPNYEVSNLGRVRRVVSRTYGKAGHVLKPTPGRRGYLGLSLCADGRIYSVQVHVIVCEVFNGERPSPKHHAAHDDGNNQNNRADNLVWKTPKENEADKVRHGTKRFGDTAGNVKLTSVQVGDIKWLLAKGIKPQRLADEFGVGRTTIRRIKDGITWKSV